MKKVDPNLIASYSYTQPTNHTDCPYSTLILVQRNSNQPGPRRRPGAAARGTASCGGCTWAAGCWDRPPSGRSCRSCRPPGCGAAHTRPPARSGEHPVTARRQGTPGLQKQIQASLS